jgi:peptidoglycan/LPS O-acetylase OafA/YrhL
VLKTDFGTLLNSVSQWLALGIGGRPAINGYADTWVINAPTWTLWYEWMFYISLPVLSLASGLIGTLAIGFAVIAWCWNTGNEFAVLNLFAGAMAAHIVHRWPVVDFMRGRLVACVALLLVVVIGILGFDRYGVWHTLLLTPLFLAVCYGNSLFGTLSYAPARLLGTISYSIYLAHALLLHAIMYWVNAEKPLIELSGLEFWSVIAGVTVILVAISTMTFRFVEYPWMKPGRLLSKGAASPLPASGAAASAEVVGLPGLEPGTRPL